MSEAYLVSLLLAGGVYLGFALHALMLARQSRQRPYLYLILLASLEAAYCVVAYGYFRQLEPAAALRWGRAICVFTPFITYVFGELVIDLTGQGQDRPRWFRAWQRVSLALTGAFSVQVVLDGVLGTTIVLRNVVETDLASAHRHRLLFAPLGQAWLAWVSASFVLFSVILFRGCRVRRHLRPVAAGCVAYFAATISDFGILTRVYDAYFIQHLGFFALVLACWWVLAGRYEMSLRDLRTAIGNLEEQRRKLLVSAPLVHRHKLDGIGALAAGVAHEINNPVHGIMNYAALLKRQVADPQAHVFATEIAAECHRVTGIVKALLSFSRVDDFQVGSVRVQDLIDEVVRLVRSTVTAGGTRLEIEIAADVPELSEGAQRLKQVIMNLLTNACDALSVRDPNRRESKCVRLGGRTQEKDGDLWLVVDVIDNADGIEPAILDRIFDPFFTTKPPGRGTGLGLAISHEIVTALGGRLTCRTVRGEGTCFRLEVPMPDSTDRESAAERPRDVGERGKGGLSSG